MQNNTNKNHWRCHHHHQGILTAQILLGLSLSLPVIIIIIKAYNKHGFLWCSLCLSVCLCLSQTSLLSSRHTVSTYPFDSLSLPLSLSLPPSLLSTIYKSDLSDKIKQEFFQSVTVSVPLYVCTTWTLKKHFEKKLDGNYARMFQAVLNISSKQPPTSKQQLLAIYCPSCKPWTRDKQDMLGTGLLRMDTQVLPNQQKLTFISSMRTLDTV